MLFIKPSYFDEFRCIASACTRSCCVGWQIMIDDQTEKKYQRLGEEGDGFILESVHLADHCFCQDKEKRCKMLDSDGLCEIIKRYGEGMLCDICKEHPRYYNVLPDRVEGGLGLCCITAAESILAMDLPPRYVEGETDIRESEDEEIYHFALSVRGMIEKLLTKNALVSEIEKSILAIVECIDDLAFDVATGISSKEEALIALSKAMEGENCHFSPFPVSLYGIEVLERHKDGWGDFLLATTFPTEGDYLQPLFIECHKRLIFYFLHRYFVSASEDLSFASRIILALSLARAILDVALTRGALADKEITLKEIAVVASEFSESFEYSPENVKFYLSRIEGLL